MAFLNAGAGATTPGNPDPRFALHTREGVADKTGIGDEMTKQMNYNIGSDAVNTAGKVITEGIKGYHIAKLEQQINAEAIQPFLNGIDPAFQEQNTKDIAQSQGELFGLKGQKHKILGTMMEHDVNLMGDLAANESSVIKEGQKLKAALGQGRMTQAEFEMRLRKVTREAINRNPGLTQELLAHAQLVESQSGVRQVKDPAKELDKAEAAQTKQQHNLLISQAKSVDFPVDPSRFGDPNYHAEIWPHIAQRLHDKSIHSELTRMHKAGEIAENYTSKQINETAPSAMRGAYLSQMDAWIDSVGQAKYGSAGDKDNAIANMNMAINPAVLLLNEQLQKQGVSPDVRKENIDMFRASLNQSVKNLTEDVSGKTLSEILALQKSSMADIQKINVLKSVDLATLDAISKIAPTKEWENFQRNNPAIANKTQDQFVSLTLNTLDRNSLDALYKRDLNPNMSNAAFLASHTLQSGNNEAAGKIITTVKELTVDFADKHFGSDVTGKVAAQGSVIREIGKLKDMDNINLSTEDRASFRALTGDYLQYAGTKFSREVAKLEADYGVDVYTRFDKDVRMIVEQKALNGRQAIAPHSEITKLNTLYATAFNDSVQAMAAIHKDSWASSSQTLVNNYADTWQFNDPGNPLIDLVNEKKKNRGIDVNAKDMIKQEEGFRNSAYEDSAGVPTIGYGFTTVGGQKVKIGDTMTRQEAEAELQVQLPKYQTFKSKVKVDLNEDQEAALTSFEYNLGKGIWDKGAKSILYAINSGDFSHAQELMLKYDKARDPKTGLLKQLPGLSNRRGREATMLAKG